MTTETSKRYALAVSGGVDSMVMLHLFADARPRPDFFVATVNHGIRPEAQSDCDFVADYCRKLGRIFCVDVPDFAQQQHLSVETAARILRYRVLDGLDCDEVCLAHNSDDNAETVLMHIIRGSGAKGACGMREHSGKYFRPLLGWSRQDILRYATQHDVHYVEDVTNDDVHYTRNFVRHKVLPLLQQLNGGVKQNILRFARNIAADEDRLAAIAEQQLQQVVFDEDGAHIPLELVSEGDCRLLDLVFGRLGVHCDVEYKHYCAIWALSRNVGGKRLDLPFGLAVYNDYDRLTVCPSQQKQTWTFCIPFGVGNTVTPLGTVSVGTQPLPNSLRIDPDKVPSGSVFRTRRQGDVFTKFGGGTKPLNRYLTDKKIPQRMRNELLLLACGNDVLAVMGVEISDKLRTDKQVYYLSLLPNAH